MRASTLNFLSITWTSAVVADPEMREKRASACYSAAGFYVVTLLLSGVCWFNGAAQAKKEAERLQ